ncbi:MAG: peptidylprolyl isomerase [Patescibacteria group bacterium]|nr:peptidylprolyl isomerase [Patescibacteria group bacterium]
MKQDDLIENKDRIEDNFPKSEDAPVSGAGSFDFITNNNEEKDSEEDLHRLKKFVLEEIGGSALKKNSKKPKNKPKLFFWRKKNNKSQEKKSSNSKQVSNRKIEQDNHKIIIPKIKNKNVESPKTGKRRTIKNKLLKLVFGILIFVILLLGVFGLGICRYNWDNFFSNFLLKFIPYPAVVVGNDFILFKDYKKDIDTVLNNFEKNKVDNFDKEKIINDLLDRLITNKIIENMAEKQGILITDEELENNLAGYINDAGSKKEFEKIINNLYLWDINDFKDRLIKPVLLADKVNNYIIWSDEFNKEKKQLADEILLSLKDDNSQKKFIETAKFRSEDLLTADKGGYLGSFSRGVMVKEFDEVAFGLSVGEISDIVKTKYGFHIIRVDEINNETIKARHILIKARNLESVIRKEKERTRIWKLVR